MLGLGVDLLAALLDPQSALKLQSLEFKLGFLSFALRRLQAWDYSHVLILPSLGRGSQHKKTSCAVS